MRFMGIDPGASGGFAVIDDDGRAWACPMPRDHKGILFVLERVTENRTRLVHCVLEHVWTSPQMGVVSAGSFMENFGAIKMALTAFDIDYELVAPVKWQNAMGVRTPPGRRAELGHKDKNISKRAAELMLARGSYPTMKITHAIADALLLAAYCRKIAGSQLPFKSAEALTHG